VTFPRVANLLVSITVLPARNPEVEFVPSRTPPISAMAVVPRIPARPPPEDPRDMLPDIHVPPFVDTFEAASPGVCPSAADDGGPEPAVRVAPSTTSELVRPARRMQLQLRVSLTGLTAPF